MRVGRMLELLSVFSRQEEIFRRDPKGSPDALEMDMVLAERTVFVYADEQGSERLCLARLEGREPSRTFKAAVLET